VTLVELLVVMALLMIVLAATLAVLQSTSRQETASQRYSAEIQDARAGLERLMHDLRQTTRVTSAGPSYVRFVLPGTTTYLVQYQCDIPQPNFAGYTQCTRVQAALAANVDPTSVALPAGSTGAPIVQRVENGTSVFTYQSTDSNGNVITGAAAGEAPTWVEATVRVPASGDAPAALAVMHHATVLNSGAYLRNTDLGT
jgi:type II secretory pathway pseudopilin PulG